MVLQFQYFVVDEAHAYLLVHVGDYICCDSWY